MTQADRALMNRMPEKGLDLIEYYKWLVHNHFILDPKPHKPKGANELVYTLTYDPAKKRYAGYKIYLHIRKAAKSKDTLSALDRKLQADLFKKKKTAKTAPIAFSSYSIVLEEFMIEFYYVVLETPSGEKILVD